MFDKHYIGLDLTGFESNGQLDKVSRITLLVDDEHAVTAGDDTGLELVSSCPHATQPMVNALLASLRGYQYKMFEADSANIDPAAELGDGATAGGIYSTISRIDDDGSGYMDVAAPGEAEETDEFPSSGPMTKEFNRKLAGIRSSITKTADQIRLEIIGVENAVSGLELDLGSITGRVQDAEGNIGQLELTTTSLSGRISDAEGGIAALEVSLDGISAEITSVENAVSSLELSLNGITQRVQDAEGNIGQLELTATSLSGRISDAEGGIAALEVSLDGISAEITSVENAVSSLELDLSGITQRVQDAEGNIGQLELTATSLSSEITSVNGSITSIEQSINDIEASVIDVEKGLSQTVSMTADGILISNEDGSELEIDGGQLKAESVTAYRLQADTIRMRTSDGTTVARFYLSDADTAEYKLELNADAIAITSEPGNVHIGQLEGSCFLQVRPGAVVVAGTFRPNVDNDVGLGTSRNRWEDIYCVNDVIQTSDRERKKDISYGLHDYEDFFNALSPCTFRFVDGHGRTHMGLIAQDIEEEMVAHGIDSMELAAFIKSPSEDGGGYDYGLRYGEFISLLIDQVQKLKKRVKDLEEAA